MDKKELRKIMLSNRTALTAFQVKQKSKDIFFKIINSKLLEQHTEILIYASYKNEVDTWEFIDYCLSRNISVALPKVNNKIMDFYYINSANDLADGYYGIKEPITNKICTPCKKSFMIMPGLVFDENGSRIGYGGGFYDRYLSLYPEIYKAAVAFDFQVIENQIIPKEQTDIIPDAIITEKRIINISKNILI